MPVLKPLAGSKDAPQQHKQTSRKGKKAWRKNVDVTEVQEGLEEVRDELIAGYEYLYIHSFNITNSIVVESSLRRIPLIFSLWILLEMLRYRRNI